MRFVGVADLHLRKDLPRCRKDEDWRKTQRKALNQIVSFCIENHCNLFAFGDLFHTPNEFGMVVLIQKSAKKLEKYGLSFYYICGNHDMLYHQSANIDNSAIGLLKNSNNCFYIKDYFENLSESDFVPYSASNFDEEDNKNAEIVFKHVLCFPDLKSLPPNVDALTAKDLLSEFPKAKWIFTGDMHKNFHYEKNGRHVVNPGCMLRQAVDFKDYQPGFYFVDTDENIVEFVPIIDKEQFVDDSYILREKEKEERIEAFAKKVGEVDSVSLDYIENVKSAMLSSNLSEKLKETIDELMEGIK